MRRGSFCVISRGREVSTEARNVAVALTRRVPGSHCRSREWGKFTDGLIREVIAEVRNEASVLKLGEAHPRKGRNLQTVGSKKQGEKNSPTKLRIFPFQGVGEIKSPKTTTPKVPQPPRTRSNHPEQASGSLKTCSNHPEHAPIIQNKPHIETSSPLFIASTTSVSELKTPAHIFRVASFGCTALGTMIGVQPAR